MPKFFKFFPKTYYSLTGPGLDAAVNITTRFTFDSNFKENSTVYYDYEIQAGDTPEIIAYKFYKNPERHWIVLLYNNIIDPQNDWPLFNDTLISYLDKKYEEQGGFAWLRDPGNIHSYYRVSERTSYLGINIIEKFQITPEEYANTGSTITNYTLQDGIVITETISTEVKTYYQYEIELNDSKRKIKLLKPDYVDMVERELKSIL